MPTRLFQFALYCVVITLITSCKKDTINGPNPGGTAHYTFDGAPGTCQTPVIAGIYSSGLAMSPANTVTFSVHVSVKGSYSINSTSVNGIYFSGAGVFTGTGRQIVVLSARGTPVRSGVFPYVPATKNTCNFIISFSASPPAAVFNYAGAPGNCVAPVVSGTYYNGSSLGAGNYVDLAVNVITPGTYTINTNNANGIAFSRTGVFTAPGPQAVRLIGNGTPTVPGSFVYTPAGNGCSFNINVTPVVPPASFTYDGVPGNCTGPVITGIYAANLTLNASNTVVLAVTVSVIGSYAVSTNSANGIVFSAAGTFTTTGANTITLRSSNTPVAGGTFSYRPTGGCSFDIVYAITIPPTVDYLICTIDGVITNFNDFIIGSSDQSGSPYKFRVDGDQTGGTDNFSIELVDNFNPIVAGNYNNLSVLNLNKNCQITHSSASGTWGSSIMPNTFVVNLTSITATKASGTFSGTMYDNLGNGINKKIITAGMFNISY